MENIQSLQSALIAELVKQIELKKYNLIIEKLNCFFESQNIAPIKTVPALSLTMLFDPEDSSETYVWKYGTSNQKRIITFYPCDLDTGVFFDAKLEIKFSYS